MSRGTLTRLLPALLAVWAAVAAADETGDGQAPRRNPFSRPGWAVALEQVPVFNAPRAELTLRATLVAGGQSLANINGRIVGVGETHEGHRVQRIEQDRVVLVKDGESISLSVYPKPEEMESQDE